MIQHAALLEGLCRAHCIGKQTAHLWGTPYRIQPTFIGTFGDGLKPMWWEPMDTRPNYYVFVGDSSWNTSNHGGPPYFSDEGLEEVVERILDLFGYGEEVWDHENGRTYTKHNRFPALSNGSGCCCWGELKLNYDPRPYRPKNLQL